MHEEECLCQGCLMADDAIRGAPPPLPRSRPGLRGEARSQALRELREMARQQQDILYAIEVLRSQVQRGVDQLNDRIGQLDTYRSTL